VAPTTARVVKPVGDLDDGGGVSTHGSRLLPLARRTALALLVGCGLPRVHAPETRSIAIGLARPAIDRQLRPWMPNARGEFRLRFGAYRRAGSRGELSVTARNHWGAPIPFVCRFVDDGSRFELIGCR